jgi:hypothetical protein
MNLDALSFGINKNVRGPVVRFGGFDEVVTDRHADNDVAAGLFQRRVHRVSNESATLTPPHIAQGSAELSRKEFRDFVFKALQLLVRERKVFGIRTNTKLFLVLFAGLPESRAQVEDTDQGEENSALQRHAHHYGSAKTVRTPP